MIKKQIIADDYIIFTTESGSSCELSRITSSIIHKDEFPLDFDRIPDIKQIYFFNRIKAIKESRGDGTCLMKRLEEYADQNNLTIINPINPYGRMNLKQLNQWFKKYGFEQPIEEEPSYIIRYPKGRKK